jgi:hypothetical protein
MRAAHSTCSKKVRQASPLRVSTGLFAVSAHVQAWFAAAGEYKNE